MKNMQASWQVVSKLYIKGPLTDFFEPLLGEIYSHITSSFLVTSELFHVF